MDARAQEEFGQFMAGRWPGLVRLAYGRILINTSNRRFRRRRVTENPHELAELPDAWTANHDTGSDGPVLHAVDVP
jgi:hypothetical protein